MTDKMPHRELREETEQDKALANQLVRDGLGDDFAIDWQVDLPRNVGILGDEGVRGSTLMITNSNEHPAKQFDTLYDRVGRVATAISNQTPTTKVLIDVTPKDAVPLSLENKKIPAIAFIDRIKTRIEGYPLLKRRYLHILDKDIFMQTAVWAIMDVKDAQFRAKMARQFAKGLGSSRHRS